MNTEAHILDAVAKIGTPCFVYKSAILQRNIERIFREADNAGIQQRIQLYISYFANSNPHLFQCIDQQRVGLLLQTEEEWHQLKKFRLDAKCIVSPSILSDAEIDDWVAKNTLVNLASIQEVAYFLATYPDAPLSFRLDASVRQDQRSGIKKKDISELLRLLKRFNRSPFSFHVYSGTASSLSRMRQSAKTTIDFFVQYFPEAEEINFGGGFAFDYTERESDEKKHFPWDAYFSSVSKLLKRARIPKNVTLVFEPGRDVLADSGQLFVKVKRIIDDGHCLQVATDGSFVYMPSANKRQRIHQTIFYSGGKMHQNSSNMRKALLCGSTTLSSDYLLPGIIPVPQDLAVNDLIAVQDVGAYAATQHLEFLNKRPAPEMIVDKNNNVFLVTQRGPLIDKIRNVLSAPEELETL